MEVCGSLGLLGGVLWDFHHPEHVSRCSTHGPANVVLQRCISRSLGAVAVHWLLIVVVFGGLGVAVGFAIALAHRKSERARRR
jgi:hypothetical protein